MHQSGQYRAELFDELIARLLMAMHPGARVKRNLVLRVPVPRRGAFRWVSIDFQVDIQSAHIVVETKAPYTNAVADEVDSALRRLKTIIELMGRSRVKTVILAIPTSFPEASRDALQTTQLAATEAGATVEVWDEEKLLHLVNKHLSIKIESLSLDELKKLLGIKPVARTVVAYPSGFRESESVVVLAADFCSYTSFVHASNSNPELITSVMARFYRETRRAIYEYEGELDKFMGDGLLAYWIGKEAGIRLEKCLERLIGIAVNIAEEWQEQIKFLVEPKGMRAGADIGNVLFVVEEPSNPLIHAIGESINIASRLQGEAKPNCLVITNPLRKQCYGDREDFKRVGPFKVKNIDRKIIAWSKTFGKDGIDASSLRAFKAKTKDVKVSAIKRGS